MAASNNGSKSTTGASMNPFSGPLSLRPVEAPASAKSPKAPEPKKPVKAPAIAETPAASRKPRKTAEQPCEEELNAFLEKEHQLRHTHSFHMRDDLYEAVCRMSPKKRGRMLEYIILEFIANHPRYQDFLDTEDYDDD